MLKAFLVFSILSGIIFLTGCEKSEEDTIAKAQACLDSATNDTVAVCEAMVAGLTGSRAAVIKCSAAFIRQGFTATRFANAFVTLKQQTAGQNATLGMMAYLVFNYGTSNTDRLTRVENAVSNCNETGLQGMIMFANFAKASTVLACGMPGLTIDPNSPPTPAQLQANLASFTGSDADLGASVTAVSTIYCGSNSSTSSAAFCTQVNQAAAAGTPAQVGASIRQLLAQTP